MSTVNKTRWICFGLAYAHEAGSQQAESPGGGCFSGHICCHWACLEDWCFLFFFFLFLILVTFCIEPLEHVVFETCHFPLTKHWCLFTRKLTYHIPCKINGWKMKFLFYFFGGHVDFRGVGSTCWYLFSLGTPSSLIFNFAEGQSDGHHLQHLEDPWAPSWTYKLGAKYQIQTQVSIIHQFLHE